MPMTRLLRFRVLATLCLPALLQAQVKPGVMNAADFAQWQLPMGSTPVNGQISWNSESACSVTSHGYTFIAVKVGRPITIVDSNRANQETVVPTVVTVSGSSCTLQAPMAHVHYSYYLQSGTAGLQEALDYNASLGIGVVTVGPDWTRAGGTTAMLNAAQGSANVSVSDQRTAQFTPYLWSGTQFVATSSGGGGASLPVATAPAQTLFSTGSGNNYAPRALQASDLPSFLNGTSFVGPVILPGPPTAALQAATKGYVDAQSALSLPLAGGTVTGPTVFSLAPQVRAFSSSGCVLTDANGQLSSGACSTATYTLTSSGIQGALGYLPPNPSSVLALTGGSLSGSLTANGGVTLPTAPSNPTDAANKSYVDNSVGGRLSTGGGNLTGPLTLAGDPQSSQQAANKNYVDNSVGGRLSINGGTLLGTLTLAGDPQAAAQAATKNYVDTKIAAIPSGGGGSGGSITLATLTPSPAPNGTATSFTINSVPASAALTENGLLLNPATDYTASSTTGVTTFVFPTAPPTGAVLSVQTSTASAGVGSYAQLAVPGTYNGTTASFTLSSTANTINLYWNGATVQPGVDYTLSGAGLTLLTFAPHSGDSFVYVPTS